MPNLIVVNEYNNFITIMKRWKKALLLLVLSLTLWIYSKDYLSFELWVSVPIVVILALGCYAAIDILGSIIKIKQFPEERLSL
jgi:hypothetical protein